MNDTTDEKIAENVKSALAFDSRLDASSIRVGVEDGVVTLAGSVGLLSEKTIAVDDARTIKGVRDVVDETVIEAAA